MPKYFQVQDNETGKVLLRRSLDVRELMGVDPKRFTPIGEAKRLPPIVHVARSDEQDPVTVAPTPPAVVASKPPPAPAKKQPSQATQEKRNAALAKARAARKASLAKAAERPQAA